MIVLAAGVVLFVITIVGLVAVVTRTDIDTSRDCCSCGEPCVDEVPGTQTITRTSRLICADCLRTTRPYEVNP